jgi:hypothetical protein
MALGLDGVTHVYAGNSENPVFSFRLGDLDVVATGLHSVDRSLFRLVATEARSRRAIRRTTGHLGGVRHAPVPGAHRA